MKKSIVLIILSIIITVILIISFLFIRFIINFKYKDEPFDKNLYYLSNTKQIKLLKKLKYKVSRKHFKYKKEKYKVILEEIPIDKYLDYKSLKEKFNKSKEWLSKGKRLIVFYNVLDNTDDFIYPENEDFISLKVKSSNQLLNQINSVYIYKNCDLGRYNRNIHSNRFKPILKYNNKTIIAEENYNEGQIIYIADYYIFSDKSILKDDNAVLLNNLFKNYYKDKIAFDQVIDIPKIEKSKSFLFMSKFPFLLIQIIIITFIFFLTFIKRFGAPLDFQKYKKRSISNHIKAVGNFLQKSNNLQAIVKIFDQYFFERLQKIIKTKTIDKKNMLNDIYKRYNLSAEEKELFISNNIPNITEIQKRRELFLKKLKRGEK